MFGYHCVWSSSECLSGSCDQHFILKHVESKKFQMKLKAEVYNQLQATCSFYFFVVPLSENLSSVVFAASSAWASRSFTSCFQSRKFKYIRKCFFKLPVGKPHNWKVMHQHYPPPPNAWTTWKKGTHKRSQVQKVQEITLVPEEKNISRKNSRNSK